MIGATGCTWRVSRMVAKTGRRGCGPKDFGTPMVGLDVAN
jgi:hypothetical protein